MTKMYVEWVKEFKLTGLITDENFKLNICANKVLKDEYSTQQTLKL